ncbi:macro domain-like protein, partial [Neoconidiobolus thromboides FSU 785]
MTPTSIVNFNEIPNWGNNSLSFDYHHDNFKAQFCCLSNDNDSSLSQPTTLNYPIVIDTDEEEEEIIFSQRHSLLPTTARMLTRPRRTTMNSNSNQTNYPILLPKTIVYEPDFEINSKVSIWQGDITKLRIDCIVNATTFEILHGSGVTRAIITAGGPDLIAECRKIGGCGAGDICVTKGYRLPCKFVLHTVGPSSENERLLKQCYWKCLDQLDKLKPIGKSIAFPCISTGVKRYPNPAAAHVALKTVSEWLRQHPESCVKRVVFCTFLEL